MPLKLIFFFAFNEKISEQFVFLQLSIFNSRLSSELNGSQAVQVMNKIALEPVGSIPPLQWLQVSYWLIGENLKHCKKKMLKVVLLNPWNSVRNIFLQAFSQMCAGAGLYWFVRADYIFRNSASRLASCWPLSIDHRRRTCTTETGKCYWSIMILFFFFLRITC